MSYFVTLVWLSKRYPPLTSAERLSLGPSLGSGYTAGLAGRPRPSPDLNLLSFFFSIILFVDRHFVQIIMSSGTFATQFFLCSSCTAASEVFAAKKPTPPQQRHCHAQEHYLCSLLLSARPSLCPDSSMYIAMPCLPLARSLISFPNHHLCPPPLTTSLAQHPATHGRQLLPTGKCRRQRADLGTQCSPTAVPVYSFETSSIAWHWQGYFDAE